MFIFELYKNNQQNSSTNWNENGFFKLLYYNETDSMNSYEFRIPLCLNTGEQCSIKKLEEQIKDFRLNQTQWKSECKLNENNLESTDNDIIKVTLFRTNFTFNTVTMFNMIIMIVISIVSLINLLLLVISCKKR